MPKLPEQQAERDFELVDKARLGRGELGEPKPIIRKYHRPFPNKIVGSLLLLVVLLVAVYTGATYLYPNFVKKTTVVVKPFEYPLNVAEVKYPSDFLKQKFLENFQLASKEEDKDKRYKLLEEDFIYLLGFYNSTHSYDSRIQLEKFKDYMGKNYPQKVEANKSLYDFACVDKVCEQAKYPSEVEQVQKSLAENTTINPDIRDSIIRNIDIAVLSKDKNNQGNAYVSVLISLALEYKTSKDETVKAMYLKLKDYVTQNYTEFRVPENVRLEV